MNRKTLAMVAGILGVLIMSLAGSAIARRTGFGNESWLMSAFALGILMLSQVQVVRLRQEIRDMEIRLAPRDDS